MAAGAVKGKPGVSTDWRAARARSRQTAELWVASGERASHSSSQQQNWNASERAAVSAVTRTVPVSRNWEWEGGRTEAHGYCSSLVVRRGKERADREGTRRRMSVQRLREDGGGQDAEL